MRSLTIASFLAFALLGLGCGKKEAPSALQPSPSASPSTQAPSIAEFLTLDAKAWVNGEPFSFAKARGKEVVLVEAWHPS